MEAVVFLHQADGSDVELSCAKTGTAHYDPDATSTLDVSDLGSPASCPGTAIENDSFQFVLYDD